MRRDHTTPVHGVPEPADADAYYDIRTAAEAECPEYVGYLAERELLTGRAGMRDLPERYAAERTTVFGSWAGGSLIAVAAVTQNRSPKYVHRGFLWGMYVVPPWRSSGVGRMLMTHVLDWARASKKLSTIVLQVTTSNVPATRLYERCGVAICGHGAAIAAGQRHLLRRALYAVRLRLNLQRAAIFFCHPR